MKSKLKESASLAALVAASVATVGCQNPAWQNPYAAFGPATVPAANMQATPQPGYYQPPAATPTISGAAPAASAPAALAPPTVTLPDGTIRTEIPTTRATNVPASTTPAVATPRRSPLGASSPSSEAPIRIVEASPAKPAGRSASGSTFATAPSDAPAAVIAANPPSRATTSSPAPAVQFNPSTTTAPLDTTPSNSPLNRTRGYMPPAASPSVPKNRTMSVPSIDRPGIRRDSSVSQAAFVETANNANGTWKAR
jgi:hypothetical protein